MDKVKAVFNIAGNNFRKWLVNPRIYLTLILLSLYIQSRLAPISQFCSTFGYKITPYVFPYLMSDRISVMIIMFGLILLFCDAPFIESEQPYIMMRSGRKMWVGGQIVYIALAALVFSLVIALISIVFLIPNIELSSEWGKVIGTFAQTSVAGQHGINLPFDLSIFLSFSAISAMLTSLFLCWFVSFFLGLIMFFFNLNISRSAGAIIAVILILWQVTVEKTATYFYNFSPVSWVSLTRIDTNATTYYPNLLYIVLMLTGAAIVLIVSSFISFRKKDIDVLKSV